MADFANHDGLASNDDVTDDAIERLGHKAFLPRREPYVPDAETFKRALKDMATGDPDEYAEAACEVMGVCTCTFCDLWREVGIFALDQRRQGVAVDPLRPIGSTFSFDASVFRAALDAATPGPTDALWAAMVADLISDDDI